MLKKIGSFVCICAIILQLFVSCASSPKIDESEPFLTALTLYEAAYNAEKKGNPDEARELYTQSLEYFGKAQHEEGESLYFPNAVTVPVQHPAGSVSAWIEHDGDTEKWSLALFDNISRNLTNRFELKLDPAKFDIGESGSLFWVSDTELLLIAENSKVWGNPRNFVRINQDTGEILKRQEFKQKEVGGEDSRYTACFNDGESSVLVFADYSNKIEFNFIDTESFKKLKTIKTREQFFPGSIAALGSDQLYVLDGEKSSLANFHPEDGKWKGAIESPPESLIDLGKVYLAEQQLHVSENTYLTGGDSAGRRFFYNLDKKKGAVVETSFGLPVTSASYLDDKLLLTYGNMLIELYDLDEFDQEGLPFRPDYLKMGNISESILLAGDLAAFFSPFEGLEIMPIDYIPESYIRQVGRKLNAAPRTGEGDKAFSAEAFKEAVYHYSGDSEKTERLSDSYIGMAIQRARYGYSGDSTPESYYAFLKETVDAAGSSASGPKYLELASLLLAGTDSRTVEADKDFFPLLADLYRKGGAEEELLQLPILGLKRGAIAIGGWGYNEFIAFINDIYTSPEQWWELTESIFDSSMWREDGYRKVTDWGGVLRLCEYADYSEDEWFDIAKMAYYESRFSTSFYSAAQAFLHGPIDRMQEAGDMMALIYITEKSTALPLYTALYDHYNKNGATGQEWADLAARLSYVGADSQARKAWAESGLNEEEKRITNLNEVLIPTSFKKTMEGLKDEEALFNSLVKKNMYYVVRNAGSLYFYNLRQSFGSVVDNSALEAEIIGKYNAKLAPYKGIFSQAEYREALIQYRDSLWEEISVEYIYKAAEAARIIAYNTYSDSNKIEESTKSMFDTYKLFLSMGQSGNLASAAGTFMTFRNIENSYFIDKLFRYIIVLGELEAL